MKHTTRKLTIRLFALITALAGLLNFLPMGALTAPLFVRAGINDYNFTPPSQDGAFTLEYANPQNSNFSENKHTSFSDNDYVAGWEAVDKSDIAFAGTLYTADGGFDTFKKNKKVEALSFLNTNPLTDDNDDAFVLMMANKTNSTAFASYHSADIVLSPDSYYQISVKFYAVGSENAIFLIPVDGENTRNEPSDNPDLRIPANQVFFQDASGTVQTSKSMWQTATFFVKTDMLSGETFKLGLYLGTSKATKGVVYYDTARVVELSAATFESRWEMAQSDQNFDTLYRNVNLSKDDDKVTLLNKIDFDTPGIDPFTPITYPSGVTQASSFVRFHELPSDLNFTDKNHVVHGNGSIDNKGVLLVSAVESRQGMRIATPVFVERQIMYMVSFYSLSTDYSYVRIAGYYPDKDKTFAEKIADNDDFDYDSDFFDVKRDASQAASNNKWVLNTIFLKGDALYDMELGIEFWVGGDTEYTGFLLVDDFAITRVSSEYFDAHKEKANSTQKVVNPNELTDTSNILNGEFNFGSVNSVTAPFPLKADSWNTDAEDETKIYNGVVNTELDHWKDQAAREGQTSADSGNGWTGYGMAVLPGPITNGSLGGPQNENNNVLMIQNKESTHQSVTSAPFTIERNQTHQIGFYASTYINSGSEINAWASISLNEKEIARIDLSRKFTTEDKRLSDWSNYTFQIETSEFSSPEVTISFMLGNERFPSAGVVFIDNVEIVSGKSKIDAKANLKDSTKLAYFETNKTVGQSLSFMSQPVNDTETAEEAKSKVDISFSKETDKLSMNTNGLQHAKVINSITESIEGGKFYEYKINVRVNIQEHGSLKNVNKNGKRLDDFDYGVHFYLQGMKDGFYNVKEEWVETLVTYNHKAPEYAELTFYIGTDSEFPLALVVEFGSEDVAVNASVGIESSSLSEITDQATFDAAKDNADKNPHTRIITSVDDDDDNDNDDNDDDDKFNFDFLLIPSIITAVAILFALAATLIRRSNFAKRMARPESTYARDDAIARGKRDIKATEAPKAKKKKSESTSSTTATPPTKKKTKAESIVEPAETKTDAETSDETGSEE